MAVTLYGIMVMPAVRREKSPGSNMSFLNHGDISAKIAEIMISKPAWLLILKTPEGRINANSDHIPFRSIGLFHH